MPDGWRPDIRTKQASLAAPAPTRPKQAAAADASPFRLPDAPPSPRDAATARRPRAVASSKPETAPDVTSPKSATRACSTVPGSRGREQGAAAAPSLDPIAGKGPVGVEPDPTLVPALAAPAATGCGEEGEAVSPREASDEPAPAGEESALPVGLPAPIADAPRPAAPSAPSRAASPTADLVVEGREDETSGGEERQGPEAPSDPTAPGPPPSPSLVTATPTSQAEAVPPPAPPLTPASVATAAAGLRRTRAVAVPAAQSASSPVADGPPAAGGSPLAQGPVLASDARPGQTVAGPLRRGLTAEPASGEGLGESFAEGGTPEGTDRAALSAADLGTHRSSLAGPDTVREGNAPPGADPLAGPSPPGAGPASLVSETARPGLPGAGSLPFQAGPPHGGTLSTASAPPAPAAPLPAVVDVPLRTVPVEIGLKALAGVKSFEMRLEPPELGRVEVRLDITEGGAVKAQLVVDRVDTLALLQRDARHLERAFEQAGLKPAEGGIDLSLRDPGTGAQGGRGGAEGEERRSREVWFPVRSGDAAEPAPAQAPANRTIWRGSAGLDLRI